MFIYFHASLLIARGVSIYTDIFSVRIIYRAIDALLLPEFFLLCAIFSLFFSNESTYWDQNAKLAILHADVRWQMSHKSI